MNGEEPRPRAPEDARIKTTVHVVYPDLIENVEASKEKTGGGRQKDRNRKPRSQMHRLRWMCLQGLLFSSILGLILLLAAVVISSIAALALFTSRDVNRLFRTFWGFYRSTTMLAFGCMVGLAFPRVGLGWIAFYLAAIAGREYASFLSSIAPKRSAA